MPQKKVPRPCSAHEEWDKMSLKDKVETLGKWAEQMTEWAENMQAWTSKAKEVFLVLNQNASGIIPVTNPFSTKDLNGGPPPPKAPKDPGC